MEVAVEQVVAVVVEVAAVVPASSVVRRVTGPEIVQTQSQEGAGGGGGGAVEGMVAAPHKDMAEAMEGGVWVVGQGQALLKVGPVTSVVSQVTGPTLAPTEVHLYQSARQPLSGVMRNIQESHRYLHDNVSDLIQP